MVEASVSKAEQCEFESHFGYQWFSSPTGRGDRLKIDKVWVRIPPELPTCCGVMDSMGTF